MNKVLVLDGGSGWILEQHLLDPQGQLIASAISSKHLRDPISGATLPRRTEIRWPSAGTQLTLELNDLEINPTSLGADLWTKPEYPGFPNVDVTQPRTMPPVAAPYGPRAPAGPVSLLPTGPTH
jgi:hypothetical protein